MGVSSIKLADTYSPRKWLKIKNEVSRANDDISHNLTVQLSLTEEKVMFELSNQEKFSNGRFEWFNPRISLLSK